MNKSKTT